MTAASSPPPRDGEVCPHGWRDARCGRFGDVGPCGCVRPAAPSEPPAADSPTPGTKAHQCGATPECTTAGHPRDAHHTCLLSGRPAVPSPVDTAEPPAEGEIDWSQHRGSCRIFYAERRCTCIGTEPPAETQQDDGLLPWHVDPFDSHRIADRDGAGVATAFDATDAARIVAFANAARPSAARIRALYNFCVLLADRTESCLPGSDSPPARSCCASRRGQRHASDCAALAAAMRGEDPPPRPSADTETLLPVRAEIIRQVREAAWAEGYEACYRGQQRHNPYRAALDAR